MTTEEKFQAAVSVINHLPKDGPYKPSNDQRLKFYSYYKQATEGPCKSLKPAFFKVVEKAKWEAWNSLGAMTEDAAMNSYIEELKKITAQIIESSEFSDQVEDFMDNVGPFYKMVGLPLPVKNSK